MYILALYLSIIYSKNKGCSVLFNQFKNIVYLSAEINPEHPTHDGITVVAGSKNQAWFDRPQLPSAVSDGRGLRKSSGA